MAEWRTQVAEAGSQKGHSVDCLQVPPEQTSSSSTSFRRASRAHFPGRAFGTGSLKAGLTVAEVGGQRWESFRPGALRSMLLPFSSSATAKPQPRDGGGLPVPPCVLVCSQ